MDPTGTSTKAQRSGRLRKGLQVWSKRAPSSLSASGRLCAITGPLWCSVRMHVGLSTSPLPGLNTNWSLEQSQPGERTPSPVTTAQSSPPTPPHTPPHLTPPPPPPRRPGWQCSLSRPQACVPRRRPPARGELRRVCAPVCGERGADRQQLPTGR